MRKKIGLAASLLLGLIVLLHVDAAYAADCSEQNGQFCVGEGSEESPYEIRHPAQLASVTEAVYRDRHFALMEDLNLWEWSDWQGEPIGSEAEPFSGSFDGNGHTISGLYFYAPQGATATHGGLFAVTAEGASIRNLGLADIYVSGYGSAGGLVGENRGSISGVYVTGDVAGSNAGGLVGVNRGTIADSYANAYVNATLAGGGLVGRHEAGLIRNTYARGYVYGSYQGGEDASLGGLIGSVGQGTVASSYYSLNASGQSDSGKGEGKSALAMIYSPETYAGWDWTSVWSQHPGANGGYPYLQWQPIDTAEPEYESYQTIARDVFPSAPWLKTFGVEGMMHEYHRAYLAEDGSMLSVGGFYGYEMHDSGIVVVKSAEDGETVWSRTFHKPNYMLQATQLGRDKLLVMGIAEGEFEGGSMGRQMIFVDTIDAQGNPLSSVALESALYPFAVGEAFDEGVLLAGIHMPEFSESVPSLGLIKLNEAGVEWESEIEIPALFGEETNMEFYFYLILMASQFSELVQTADGAYLLTFLNHLVKIDSTGGVVWTRNTELAGEEPSFPFGAEIIHSLTEENNGYAFATLSLMSEESPSQVYKTDRNGEIGAPGTWRKPVNAPVLSLAKAADGGYMALTPDVSQTTSELALVKLNAEGEAVSDPLAIDVGSSIFMDMFNMPFVLSDPYGGYVVGGRMERAEEGDQYDNDLFLLRFKPELSEAEQRAVARRHIAETLDSPELDIAAILQYLHQASVYFHGEEQIANVQLKLLLSLLESRSIEPAQ